MLVMFNGRKIPVRNIKHWSFHPEEFVPNRSGEESWKWSIFMGVKDAWDRLDPSIFRQVLSPSFTYGSYWVTEENLDRSRYLDYIEAKFNTIRNTHSGPQTGIAVLYEGIAPEKFYYALSMRQGELTSLLTFGFDKDGISSLYMTDPEIFTYEPTFMKGGIVDENGEPRIFTHKCFPWNKGRVMSASQFQSFAVECVTKLFTEAGAEIKGSFKSKYKEFPNIITKCGADTFYHRIDVSMPTPAPDVFDEELKEYISAAEVNKALPMVMPVSLYCFDSNGGEPLCGGQFFIKVLESRMVR